MKLTVRFYGAVTSCEDTGTHAVHYKQIKNNNLSRQHISNRKTGEVMKKLCLTNPPLHLPDWRFDKSLVSWNVVLSQMCDWYMHRVTVSHNVAATSFYIWSEDGFLISGFEPLAGGVRLSLRRCWQADGRWPTAWCSVISEVLAMWETSYSSSQKDWELSEMLFEVCFLLG